MYLKNFISILFVFLSCFAPCLAQNSSEQHLFPIWDELGKYGFIDASGRVVVKPQFEEAYPSSEGLAAVGLGKEKSGFLDMTGKIVIPLKYNWVSSFSDGLAAVSVKVADGEYQCGYIDRTGKFVIKPRKEFLRCNDFSQGFAQIDVSDPNIGEITYTYINKKGEFAIGGGYARAEPFSDGWALVNDFSKTFFAGENSKVIDLNPLYHPSTHSKYYHHIGSFSEGLALICSSGSKNWGCDSYGFINPQGKIALMLPENLRSVYRLNRPVFWQNGYGLRENRLIVAELKTVKVKLEFYPNVTQYKNVDYYSYGYIDRTGKVVIPPRFHDAADFSDGLAVVWMGMPIQHAFETVPVPDVYFEAALNIPKDKWQCIDTAGKVIIENCGEPLSHEEIRKNYQNFGENFGKGFVNGLFFSKTYVGTGTNQKVVFGYMNKKGKYVWIAPPDKSLKLVNFGATDFIVASSYNNRIVVYDQNLVFRGNLDTSFDQVTGVDFLPNGNLVAAGHSPSRIKIYNSKGTIVSDFSNKITGEPSDVKASSASLLYVKMYSIPLSAYIIAEFTIGGKFKRGFGEAKYGGVAILPGGVLWAGNEFGKRIDVFSIATGVLSSTITLDNEQESATSMYYSPVTNTVLITDKSKGKVYERTTAGVFVRQFTVPPGNTTVLLGVTRGPSGDVFATDAAFGRVYRWSATNTYIGHTELTGVYAPSNIVWAGNRKATAASVTGSERVLSSRGKSIFKARMILTQQRRPGNRRQINH